jgi:hypothetical protein
MAATAAVPYRQKESSWVLTSKYKQTVIESEPEIEKKCEYNSRQTLLVGGRLYTERDIVTQLQDEPAKTSKIIIKWPLNMKMYIK